MIDRREYLVKAIEAANAAIALSSVVPFKVVEPTPEPAPRPACGVLGGEMKTDDGWHLWYEQKVVTHPDGLCEIGQSTVRLTDPDGYEIIPETPCGGFELVVDASGRVDVTDTATSRLAVIASPAGRQLVRDRYNGRRDPADAVEFSRVPLYLADLATDSVRLIPADSLNVRCDGVPVDSVRLAEAMDRYRAAQGVSAGSADFGRRLYYWICFTDARRL